MFFFFIFCLVFRYFFLFHVIVFYALSQNHHTVAFIIYCLFSGSKFLTRFFLLSFSFFLFLSIFFSSSSSSSCFGPERKKLRADFEWKCFAFFLCIFPLCLHFIAIVALYLLCFRNVQCECYQYLTHSIRKTVNEQNQIEAKLWREKEERKKTLSFFFLVNAFLFFDIKIVFGIWRFSFTFLKKKYIVRFAPKYILYEFNFTLIQLLKQNFLIFYFRILYSPSRAIVFNLFFKLLVYRHFYYLRVDSFQNFNRS